jgi:hypothetical protein
MMNLELLITTIGFWILTLSCLFAPIKVLQILYLWPKFISERISATVFSTKQNEMLSTIYSSPEQFEYNYRFLVLGTRIVGGFMFLLAIFGTILLILENS